MASTCESFILQRAGILSVVALLAARQLTAAMSAFLASHCRSVVLLRSAPVPVCLFTRPASTPSR
jgi:hypothetical protein